MDKDRMAGQSAMLDPSDVLVAARDTVIEVMEQGVIVLDCEGCVLDVNPAAQEMLDRCGADPIGKPLSDLSLAASDVFDRLPECGEGRTEMTLDRNERKQVFQVRIVPIRDRHGRPLGTSVLLRDITDRRLLEKVLCETKEAARVSNQAKSDFMSVASHEMRTPITSIKGYTDLLARGTVGPINDTQADFLDTIRTNVDRIALLVSDLSDIARIESGALSLELGPVDISDVARDAVASLQAQIDAKDQLLIVDVPEGLPPVQADHERSVQALSNVISNAHKFTPEGGRVAVRASRGFSPRSQRDAAERQVVLIAVEDNGIGIKPEEQDRVFEKFYRSEDREASDMPGSGLGLSIAANLVKMQGGQIWLESVFREGTTVSFTLPVVGTASDEI